MDRQATRKEETQGGAETGAMVPVHRMFPSLPSLAERFEELLGEPLAFPRWALRGPEIRWSREMARMPAVDVFEEGDAVVVKAEVPGMAREDLDVSISGDVLTVSGKREKEEKVERKDYHRWERSTGSFSRSVLLPAEVETEKVTARLHDGILEIRAPKTAAAKARSRKIEIG